MKNSKKISIGLIAMSVVMLGIGSVEAAINGQCGSSNGRSFINTPTSGLCVSGMASKVYSISGQFRWTCNGYSGGKSVSCYATDLPNPIAGVCGSAHGRSYFTAPTSGLCQSGKASSVSGTSNRWQWSCTGSNGGGTTYCYATKESNPSGKQCGTVVSSGKSFLTTQEMANQNLCAAGYRASGISKFSSYKEDGMPVYDKWRWTCKSGNTTTYCYVDRKANGVCGRYNISATTSPSSCKSSSVSRSICQEGVKNFVPTDPCSAGNLSWVCQGINGGSSVNCSQKVSLDGYCGKANGKTYTTRSPYTNLPSADFCERGQKSAVTCTFRRNTVKATIESCTWTCGGVNGGRTKSCSLTYEKLK